MGRRLTDARLVGGPAVIGRGSGQQTLVALDRIEDSVAYLRGGLARAVLEVGSINFRLKGEVEQEAIIAGYAACLNSLTFPVQILVRVLPIDVERYLTELEERARRELNDALIELARDHLQFVRRLARSRTLLERRFYVVVPGGDSQFAVKLPWVSRRREHRTDKTSLEQQITFRCEEVERQLTRCGLQVRRLGDTDLAQLYYSSFCPELARLQRLKRDLSDYTTAAVLPAAA